MATVTRTTIWSDGQNLTASALNGEFNNLLNALALTNADISGGAGIVESKLTFSGSGHGHTGTSDGKLIVEASLNLSDNTTADVSTSKHGFVPKAPNDATKFLKGDATWSSLPTTIGADGWTATTDSWTYLSASSVTVPSGAASLYQKGDRVKFTQTTVKYFTVAAVTDTTLTFIVNNDFTVANAGISAISYSHQLNPVGYPTWFNYTPTITGYSSNPTSTLYQYSVMGSMCTVVLREAGNGTSNATNITYTAPLVSSGATNGVWISYCEVVDSGTATYGQMSIPNNNIITIFKQVEGPFTNSGNKRVVVGTLVYAI